MRDEDGEKDFMIGGPQGHDIYVDGSWILGLASCAISSFKK